jgi:hypothetical protein
LDAYIKGTHRFIEHNELRFDGERACDADPLPLSPGELVRVPVVVLFAEPYPFEEISDALPPLVGRLPVVNVERFADNLTHSKPVIETRLWVLKHDLRVPSPAFEFVACEGRNIRIVNNDLAIGCLF